MEHVKISVKISLYIDTYKICNNFFCGLCKNLEDLLIKWTHIQQNYKVLLFDVVIRIDFCTASP